MQDTKKFYPVKGFEDYYEITKCGIVRSKPRIINKSNGRKQPKKGYILKYDISNKGYYRVSFNCIEIGLRRKFSIHRLIALTFIPNPNNYPVINHINAITTDNRIENLEWCTQSKNVKHKFDIGYITTKRVLKDNDVIDIYNNAIIGNNSRTGIKGVRGNIKYLCDKYNTTRTVIYGIIHDKTYLNVTKHLKRKEL